MFGLTRREQRWKAEQKAVETVIPLLTAAIQAGTASRDIDDEKNKAVAAATAPLLARIAELERLRSEDHAHALDLAAEIERLTPQLAEARKQMEAQKDEWLSWEAKRRDLEADAGRWREWEQGRGLTVVVPAPTDDKPNRKVTIIYSSNPYPAYPTAVRAAIDAAIKEQT